ncbi:nicotinate (nicotinamide) nucleotide adenylyltransferase [Agaribacter flavus]|uniref:Probable nicotinate-nucleotide adenylyltransferase n=1 Tax=Agaribacter flavus TaxID=1902781 RepID=A0ABV7FMS9_9ALTE
MISAFFGGTFDPPHLGHKAIINYVHACLHIQNIQLLPCHIPPHKCDVGAPSQRLTMCKLLADDLPYLSINTYELNKHSCSYTFDTVKYLNTKYPNDSIVFIIGEDSFLSLHSWYRWQELLLYCHLIVLPRLSKVEASQDEANIKKLVQDKNLPLLYSICDDSNQTIPQNYKKYAKYTEIQTLTIEQMQQILNNTSHGAVFLANAPHVDISSTQIRQAVQAGKSINHLVPAPVNEFILNNNLYRIGDN